jgi:alpha-1,6-mannosyltransferase
MLVNTIEDIEGNTEKNTNNQMLIFYISLLGFSLSILASFWIEQALPNSSLTSTNILTSVIGTSTIGSSIIGSSIIGTATIMQYLLGGLFMLLAWRCFPRQEHPYQKLSSQPNSFLLVIALGIVLRLLLIPIDSYTSSDTTRYLFDGKLAYEGIDPYQTAHDAPELKTLKQQWAPPEEHAKYATLYPPLALSLFAISASTGVEYATLTWKLIVTFFSILTLLLAAHLLRLIQREHYLPLIALSPLLILEAGVGAHLDTLSAFSILLIVYNLWQKKPIWLGISITIGTAIKLLPLALLMPIFLLAVFKRKVAFAFITAFSTLFSLVFIYGATFALGFKPIGSIGVFFQKWRFGSPLFTYLENNFSDQTLLITVITLFISGLMMISAYLYFSNAAIRDKLISAMQYVMALPLILTPVIFPWYLMPLAVLAALHPKPWLLTWVLLAPLSYEVLNQFLCCAIWQPAEWPLVILAFSVASILLLSLNSFILSDKKLPAAFTQVMPSIIKRSL